MRQFIGSVAVVLALGAVGAAAVVVHRSVVTENLGDRLTVRDVRLEGSVIMGEPNEQVTVSAVLPPRPPRTDGTFEPRIEVVGLVEYGGSEP